MATALNEQTTPSLSAKTALRVLVAYLAIFSGLFLPMVMQDRVIAGADGIYQFLPLYEEPSTPWVNTAFGGYPAFADPQGLRHYPIAQLMHAVGFSFNAFTIAGLVLAAWFVHLTAFLLTRRHLAALVGGLAYGLSSFFIVHLVHVTMVHAGAWMAACLFCLVQWHLTQRRGWLTLLALCAGLLVLAGAPQLAVYGLGWLGLFAVVLGLRRRSVWHTGWAALALAAGLGLSAIQVIPTAELVGFTPRAAITRDNFLSNAFDWSYLPSLVVPRAYQSHRGPLPLPDEGDLHVTVGLTCLLLAVFSVFFRAQRFWVVTFASLAGLSLLLSSREVAQWLYKVPIYNLFRGPTRHHLFMALGLSLGGALGTAALIDRQGRLRWRELLAMAGVVLLCFSPWLFTHWPSLPPRVYLFVIGGIVVLTGLKVSEHPGWVLAMLGLGVTEPFVNVYAMPEWRSSPPMADASLSPEVVALAEECRNEGCRLLPWSGFWSSGLPGNLSRLHGVPNLAGYNVMYLRRLGELLDMDPNGVVLNKSALSAPTNRALDLLGVRYLLSSPDDVWLLREEAGFHPVGSAQTETVVKNDDARPRAWFVSRHETVTDAEAMTAVRTGVLPSGAPFEPADVAALEGTAPETIPSQAEVTTVFERPGQLKFRLSAHQGGVLVVNDMWYPGWKAVATGGPRPVMRANAVQLGVVLEAGDTDVTVEFSSMTRRLGAIVSILSGLFALALSWRVAAQAKPSNP